ncbi:hypothetical protein V6Z12_D04G181300 [Gossypium hirsutum]
MAWICAINPKCCNKICSMLFFDVVWSIWSHRNEMIFNNKIWDRVQVIDVIFARASFDDILHFPLLIQSPIRKKLARSSKRWHPPQSGFLKFNIDGAASGRDGLADIGGVLIKELGEVLISFSRAVGESYSITAELLAI